MIDICIAAADRLRTQAGSSFTQIGMAAELNALADLPRTAPAAFLIPVGEQATPTELLKKSAQRHTCVFDVLLIVRHAGDASGTRSSAALQALRADVQDALVNWQPATDCGPVQFANGSLADLVDGTTIWQDQFTFDRWVRHD